MIDDQGLQLVAKRSALLCASACPDSVVLIFEGLVTGIDTLANQYADLGIVFDGALVVSVPNYNSFDYPPRSGITIALSNVFRAPTTPITIRLDEDARRVRGYFTANAPVTLACYDAANQLIASNVFPGGNLGRTGLPTNQPLQVEGSGIRSCTLDGPRGFFSIEDLTIVWRDTPLVPELTVVSAAGSNTGGSFTVRSGESRIDVQASVTPSSLGPRVKWLVDDDGSDQLQTVPPATVPDGVQSAFNVPSAQLRARYSAYTHPGVLTQKTLALRVRARVTDDNAQTVTSANEMIVRQDEIDTMREEYIELGVPQGVPARNEFKVPDGGHPNAADYTKVLHNATFDEKFSQLVTAWTERSLLNTITGGYRNPVHNWRHITPRSGSGPVGASWHMYACALDLQTFPQLRSTSPRSDTLAARAYWDRLSAKALATGFRVEPRDRDPNQPNRPFSGVGHVHVEIRCR